MVPRVFLLFVTARVVTFGVVLGFSPTTLLPFSHSYSSWMPPPTTQNEFSTRQHNTLVGKLSAKSSHENDEPDDTNHVGDGRAVNRRDVMVKGAASFAAATVAWGGDMGGTEHASGLWVPKSAHAATTTTTTITAPTEPRVVVPTTKLGSLTVSRTIQGYWQLAGGHGKYKETDAIDNMNAHYNAGITTLDTADIYGPSELIVGTFVKRKQPKAIPCTKFCCFRYLEEIDKTEVRNRIQKSCERLQVSKLPLVQFFWGNYDVKRYVDVALMLTELKEEGLIGEIGATNFDLPRLQEMKKAGVPIVSHQVQLSALDRRPVQSGMADWCAENGVGLIAFGTVGSGILSERYLRQPPPTPEQKDTASMRMYSNTAARFGSWKLVQELLETLDIIAASVRFSGRCIDATISNVAQRYILETEGVSAILIGVRNQKHIAENVRTHAFQLNADEREAIDAIVAKRSGPKGDVWDIERGNI